jgi:MOSC domain-containing protein
VRVDEIWRYPVKSLRGEQLKATELLPVGIPGDRVVHVRAANGRMISARTHPDLLTMSAVLAPDGEPLVDGLPWNDPRTLRAVRMATWNGASLVRSEGLDRFDVLPISLVTDGAVAALGTDRRRLRPNILVGGVEGLAEREWPGSRLRVGRAVLEVVKLRSRCVMTTFDPDTSEPDPTVLQRIVDEFDGQVALDCGIVEPGRIAVGDPVELL